VTHVTKVTNEATPALSGFAAVPSQPVTPGTLSVIVSQAVTPAEVAHVTTRDSGPGHVLSRLRAWLIRVLWLYRATGPLPGRAALPAPQRKEIR
jgi:hypothetical protein